MENPRNSTRTKNASVTHQTNDSSNDLQNDNILPRDISFIKALAASLNFKEEDTLLKTLPPPEVVEQFIFTPHTQLDATLDDWFEWLLKTAPAITDADPILKKYTLQLVGMATRKRMRQPKSFFDFRQIFLFFFCFSHGWSEASPSTAKKRNKKQMESTTTNRTAPLPESSFVPPLYLSSFSPCGEEAPKCNSNFWPIRTVTGWN